MTSSNPPPGPRVLDALSEMSRSHAERPTKPELNQGLAALHLRIANHRNQRRRLARTSLIGLALVCTILISVQLLSFARKGMSGSEPMLTYKVEGGSVLEGGYLRGSAGGGIQLSFNEGSRLELTPGSRGRLREVAPGGARVALENGTATFQVTPSNQRRWLVEVGPFLVTVKGTAFVVSWDPGVERFELRLREGRVLVSGPVSSGDLALRAGQRLVVDLPRAETVISEDRSEPSHERVAVDPGPLAVSSSAPPIASTADKPAPSSTAAPMASTATKAEVGRRWADDLASGNWDRILEHAERRGVEATLNEASSEELFALADAARYRRRADLAHSALLAQRRRFPNSPRALDAVFLLGRVEEARANGTARAMGWYDEYLARAPGGAYAAEALGRKMTITNQLAGSAQARPLAEEYLRRFPKGSYAGSARALLRAQ